MIIVGDIASPTPQTSDDLESVFREYENVFGSNSLICNLEGLICDTISTDTNTPVLYNHSSVIRALELANTKVAALANNHTLDLPACFSDTVQRLSDVGIATCGAGTSKDSANAPLTFVDGGIEIVLFNSCWDFLLYHQRNPDQGIYVAEIDNLKLMADVAKVRQMKPQSRIVIFLHWSLDLEILPFPMYRQLSKELIDAGANLVVGTHSHCVQGGEKYNDGYIVYGLGNFFIPHHCFANGKLTFPAFSRLEMAFEWNPISLEGFCHWFQYEIENGRHRLKLLESAPFENSSHLRAHSPYDQTCQAYLNYFRANRRKRFLIPVYRDPRAVWRNAFLTKLLKSRATVARTLAKLKLVKWQS